MTTLELIERGVEHNCLSDAYELGRKDVLKELEELKGAGVMNYVITEKLPQFGENTYKEIPIPDSLVKQIRTDAIDEFAKGIAKECGNKPYYNDLCLCLARIFEQLKEQKQ